MVRAVLIRISTQEVIKKSNYPKNVVEPLVGLDPDLEWLIVNELDKPIFDESIEKLVRVEQITTDAHPIYPDFNEYKISYSVTPLTQSEIDSRAVEQEDTDQYGLKQQTRLLDGNEMARRFFAYIHRQVGLGNLTGARAMKASNYMLTGLNFLSFGEMELAKNSFNSIDLSGETAPNQAAIQQVIDLAVTKVQNYINNE